MSRVSLGLGPTLNAYLGKIGYRESVALLHLREETAALPAANMQISPDQGAFMALMVELLGVKRYLEVGTFTGYSALVVALAMGPEGRITACDISKEWTDIARRHWRAAGIQERIDLRLAPAAETLKALEQEGRGESFDFVFIDADKKNYDFYYEAALRLVRPGGLIAIDNVLWGGRVVDLAITDEDTAAIRMLNQKIHADARVSLAMLPLGDGLTLARKRQVTG